MSRIRLIMMVILLAAFGLSACGQSAGTSGDQGSQAGEQFLNERGATAVPAAGGANTPQEAAPPVMGMVEQVEGDKFVVKEPMTNASTTVQLVADTKITKQVAGQLSDIKAGDTVTALGVKDGDTFSPETIDIGATIGGGLMFFNSGPSPFGEQGDGAAPAPGDAAAVPAGAFEPLSGSVEKVEGSKVTVKSAEGASLIMDVTDKVRISKVVDAQADEIQAGKSILAEVSRDGQVIQAKQVQILPDGMAP